MQKHTQLLKEYVDTGNETAFGELVRRYIDLVYSAALRRTSGDAHLAEDVVQTVFIDLAKKAPSLTGVNMLGGWLHRHTCFVASNIQRTERRRQLREKENSIMHSTPDEPNDEASQLKSVLDEAINDLAPDDREAVILRFFDKQSLRTIGKAIGSTEDAAQKRVSRAIEKLRVLLAKRGVALSGTALASQLTGIAVEAAPEPMVDTMLASIQNTIAHTPSLGLSETAKVTSWVHAGLVALLAICFGVWILMEPDHNDESTISTNKETELTSSIITPTDATPAPGEGRSSMAAPKGKASPEPDEAFHDRMELTVVSKASGKALEGVLVEYRAWEGRAYTKNQFSTDDQGVSKINVPFDTITHLQLYARVDGYADTKLDWRMDRGEQVPLFYTLKLDPAVTIGGVVHDPTGFPVANARVGFNHSGSGASPSRPESHEFGWIQTETGSDGRWVMKRIAADMIPRLYGGARHDAYVGSPMLFVSQDASSEALLKTQEHVFILSPGAGVSGTVLTPEKEPIEGAVVLIGRMGDVNSRETKTKADGTFHVKGCKPGMNLVTASASGFAAATIRTEIADGLASIELQLKQAKTLRLRVVDYLDQPVVGANVWLNTMSSLGNPQETMPPLTQVEFSEKTDQTGRVVWYEAPDKELTFDIAGKGNMRMNGFKAHPDGTEYVVKMLPSLEVFGTVRDAETMNPIDSFSVLAGWPESNLSGQEAKPRWSGLDRHRMMFSGGEFRHVFEEAIISGIPNPGYMLKFESEGFTPYVTRVIAPDEIEVPLDIVLERGEEVTIQTFLPNGKPALHADIGLSIGNTSYTVGPGRISRDSSSNVMVTDEKGRFKVPSDDAIRGIIVAHPEGFADVDPEIARNEKQIRLLPWGTLMGQYLSGRFHGNRTITLRSSSGFSKPYHLSHTYSDTLDASGRFKMEMIPPGNYELNWRIEQETPHGQSWTYKKITPLEIKPGEHLDILIDFRTVQFQLIWPEGLERNESWKVFAWMSTPQPQMPEGLHKSPGALAAWAQQPEVQAMMRAVKSQNFEEQENGQWVAYDVIPDDAYTLHVSVVDSSGGPQKVTTIASGNKKVKVPEGDLHEQLDLGVIDLIAEFP